MELQPLILIRTSPLGSASTAIDLQVGGYVICKAFNDDMALWLARTAAPEAVVVELGLSETEEFLSRVCNELPVLVLSSLPRAVKRRFPFVTVLPAGAERHELVAAVDRLLIEQARHFTVVTVETSHAPSRLPLFELARA